ncbi:MAG: hypothetical protein MHM6MM_004675, partial [Cercozoa sp. M6MM]
MIASQSGTLPVRYRTIFLRIRISGLVLALGQKCGDCCWTAAHDEPQHLQFLERFDAITCPDGIEFHGYLVITQGDIDTLATLLRHVRVNDQTTVIEIADSGTVDLSSFNFTGQMEGLLRFVAQSASLSVYFNLAKGDIGQLIGDVEFATIDST